MLRTKLQRARYVEEGWMKMINACIALIVQKSLQDVWSKVVVHNIVLFGLIPVFHVSLLCRISQS